MNQNRKLAKLLFKDNFMFGAVMVNEEICRDFLEMAVGLLTGEDYRELPAAYVIFICDFDPFGQKKYRYTIRNTCAETGLPIADGSTTIFLSTCGKNESEVPTKLVKFLKFVKADLTDCFRDYQDDFIRKIQEFMEHVRSSREMEEKFMLLEELLKDERAEGKAEGKAESILLLLQDIGSVPDGLRNKILKEQDMEILLKYLKLAARVDSIADFEKEMDKI